MANPQENEPMFSGLDSYDEDNSSLAASLLTTTGPLDNSPAVSGAFNPATSDWSMPFQDGLPYDSLENNGAFGGLYNPSAFTFQSPWEGNVQFAPQPQQQQRCPPQGPVGHFAQAGKPIPPQSRVNKRGPSRANSGSESPYPGAATSTLTVAQQEQLKNIAMPAHLKYRSPKSEGSPNSSGGDDKGIPSSPDMPGKSQQSRKRKSSADEEDDDDDEDESGQPVKKTAHNMIEKRYRTNLNDKIAALRDSVPSLRIMSKSARGEDTTEDREELHGLTPAHKLNKATVLSKATEYIRHLEKRNDRLRDENATMQQRISAFEKLFMHGAMNGTMSPIQPPTPIQFPQDPTAFVQTPMATPRGPEPQGMIQVPEEMKRIIQAQQATGRPYPVPQQPFHANPAIMRQQIIQQQQQQVLDQSRWQNAGPYFGKLMVGSLAALMVLEVVRESEQSNESPEGRGLFGAPIHFLSSIVSRPHISIGGYHVSTPELLHSLKLLVLMGSLLWVFVPRLFVPGQKKSPKVLQAHNASLQAVPSLASPIHVRRQAWLTAIQTVWVPRHNFFLEAAALILKTMKLSLRNTIGIHGYQLLTGLTEDQETARVKAWTIALDAQLAGGDVEINKSRLTLTLLASGTLPDTPLRLMLKALHCRVLLLQDSMNGVVDLVAAKLARAKWNEAKELHRMIQQLKRKDDEELPEHLALLLEQDCDSVFSKDIVQRAHNLAWNRPTTYNICVDKDGMNAVVEDPAVRSPMDAVAAWWSCSVLQEVLSTALLEDADSDEDAGQLAKKIELATRVAPIGSNAQLRALVARAVLVDEKRGTSIANALTALEPTLNPDKHPSYSSVLPPLIDSPWSLIMADGNVQMSLRCAMSIAHLQRYTTLPPVTMALINSILQAPVDADAVSLLGVTAAFRLMNRLHQHSIAKEQSVSSLERLAGTLRIWIGGAASDACGLDTDVRQHTVDRCVTITKSVMGMNIDQGYASMSDCEGEEGGC